MKIYTKSGDKGKTGIHGGQRVDKDDIRIEANGCIDELNSMIGVVRSFLPPRHEWQELLFKIQTEIMVVMSHVATPSAIRDSNPNQPDTGMVAFIESQIDRLAQGLDDGNSYFVLPGGNLVSAHLHMARTIARRSERRLWTLNRQDELPPSILQFVNRLSDLFFVMARYEMQSQGEMEDKWQHFLYKRKGREAK